MNDNRKIYAVTVEVTHVDLYDLQDDGTTVLGLYDDRHLAESRLSREYERDRADLLGGSCAENGKCEITEDEPLTIQSDGTNTPYAAFAQIVVGNREDDSFEREYTYRISEHVLND